MTGSARGHQPEEDAQDVGDEQHQADPGGEALAVVAPLDVLVLRHVRQGSAEDHEAGRQPGQQRPGALHALSLEHHLGIHGCQGSWEKMLRESCKDVVFL